MKKIHGTLYVRGMTGFKSIRKISESNKPPHILKTCVHVAFSFSTTAASAVSWCSLGAW